MADQITLVPVPRLDCDEQAWLDHELAEHPEVGLERALVAVASVRPAHMTGACS